MGIAVAYTFLGLVRVSLLESAPRQWPILIWVILAGLGYVAAMSAYRAVHGGKAIRLFYARLVVTIAGAFTVTGMCWFAYGTFGYERAMQESVRREGATRPSETRLVLCKPDNAVHWFELAQKRLKGMDEMVDTEWEGRPRRESMRSVVSYAISELAGKRYKGTNFRKAVMVAQQNAEAIELLLEGARRHEAYWIANWGEDDGASYSLRANERQPGISLAKVTILSAILDAGAGAKIEAGRKLKACLALSYATSLRPHFLFQMRAVGINRAIVEGVNVIFEQGKGLEEVKGWGPYLRSTIPVAMSYAMFEDEFRTLPFLIVSGMVGGNSPELCTSVALSLWSLFFRPFTRYDFGTGLAQRLAAAEALYGLRGRSRKAPETLKDAYQNLEIHHRAHMVHTLLKTAVLSGLTELRLIEGAIWMRRSQSEGMAWLTQSSDLFTGRRFAVKQGRGDVLIYSLGPDGVDDGGAKYDRQTGRGDISRLVDLRNHPGLD